MYHSRDINDLRADVGANCRVFLDLCAAEGLKVLVTETVRDEAYQRYCYEQGYASTSKPSFHGIKAGLAFDICKNVKGHEYDDATFFARCGELGEKVGFEWGGRWKSFPDRPHFQWSEHGKYTSSMVRAGKVPPAMPLYREEIEMSKEEVQAMVDEAVVEARRAREAAANVQPVSPWAKESWDKLTAEGVFDGTRPGAPLTREQAAVVIDRLRK